MTPLERQLLAKCDALEARVEELEAILGMSDEPIYCLGLTGKESAVLGFLRKREMCTKEQILSAVYGHLPSADDVPYAKIVDVFVCKIRKKLRNFDERLRIETVHGVGWRLAADVKALLDEVERGPLNATGRAA